MDLGFVSKKTAGKMDEIVAKTADLFNVPFQAVKKLQTKVAEKGKKLGGRRLRNIFAAPLDFDDTEPYHAPEFPKTDSESAFLYDALKKNFVFADLSQNELIPLVRAFEKVTNKTGDVIIRQGDLGDYFYIILQGSCSVTVDGKIVGGLLRAGASFGELALMYFCPRAATITATDDQVILFRVDQVTFRRVFQSQVQSAELQKRKLIDGVDFMVDLSEIDKQKLVDHMTVKIFNKGDQLVIKGQEASFFWMLEKGEVMITDIEVAGKKLADVKVEAGSCFGEQAILRDVKTFSNCFALTAGQAFVIEKNDLIASLGDLNKAKVRSLGIKGLSTIKVIHDSNLSKGMLESLVKYIAEVSYKKGEYIMQRGQKTEAALYILREGSVHLHGAHHNSVTMKDIGIFGDDMLLLDAKRNSNRPKDSTQMPAPYTVQVLSDEVVFGVLKLSDCRTVFDTTCLGDSSKSKVIRDSIADKKAVTIKDFDRHTILGAGTFGQVWLVSRTTSSKEQLVYALKIQSKYELVENSQAKGVVHEKQIMADLHHPFVTNLVAAFKDEKFVYMLMDLVQGGELEGLMHNDKRDELPEKEAVFYSAGITEGLLYMHRRGYVYRDLKPQNVLISNEGFPIIADFGFAKHVTLKTYTFCGTPLYLAPEIILNRGHNWGADHWSLGILIFEMLTGYTPFYDESMDQMDLFRAIVQSKLVLPKSLSKSAKSIITGFLQKKPQHRLGSLEHGLEDIYRQDWFKEIDFNKLRHKEITPPYVPVIGNPLDASNFDDWSGMEDKMGQDYPRLKPQDEALFDEF